MIPFDADALLAMLRAFYPVVGPAALARARSERPEYFAGGEIRGSAGDKLWLGDGRKFDLIFQVGTPQQAWQVLELPNGDGVPLVDDPFALEDGPLTPIDESAFLEPSPATVFTDLVAEQLGELPNHEEGLRVAQTTIADNADPAPLDNAFAGFEDDVAGGVTDALLTLGAVDNTDVLTATAASAPMIDANDTSLDEPTPVEIGPGTLPPPPPDTPPIDVPIIETP